MHHACTATRNVQVRGLLLETLGQRALCAGWLIKLGTERKNWRKRFAVLLAEPTMQLRYYSDAQLSDCRGKPRPLHTSPRPLITPYPCSYSMTLIPTPRLLHLYPSTPVLTTTSP